MESLPPFRCQIKVQFTALELPLRRNELSQYDTRRHQGAMGNLSTHKSARLAEAIHAHGAMVAWYGGKTRVLALATGTAVWELGRSTCFASGWMSERRRRG